MGRAPCCSKVGLHRGPWTANEDSLLINYIQAHGEGQWRSLPKKAGLLRCGKSCRLRWLNYLRPDIKRGNITPDEDDLIIRLHALLGNKWSLIAGRLPGRTDNEIKNYWNTYLSKRLRSKGTDPNAHKLLDVEPGPPKKRRTPNNKNLNKEERTKIHMPKAVRVTSCALKRNDSLASFESNAATLSASTSNHGEAVVAPYWPSDESVNVSYDGVRFMIGCEGEEDPEVGQQAGTVHPHASDLDKLYDEYLQLLKVDDDCVDANQELEFDYFAESLLI